MCLHDLPRKKITQCDDFFVTRNYCEKNYMYYNIHHQVALVAGGGGVTVTASSKFKQNAGGERAEGLPKELCTKKGKHLGHKC